jgi:hypothetical protein
MLYVDHPSTEDIAQLNTARADACISIYLPTTPLTQHIGAARIAFGNLAKSAIDQLIEAGFDKRRRALIEEGLGMLAADDAFWRVQANSLAVFATPERVITFRLANKLSPMVEVSDRFHLKPLLRAVTFPHQAFVLALSENRVRLIEVLEDAPPHPVKIPALPKDAASHARKATINDRSPSGRIQGAEGQRVRHMQYLRAIDAALRPVLAGSKTPLILAAVDPLASLFRIVNSYPHLLASGLAISPDKVKDAELARQVVPLLDKAHAEEIKRVTALFETRSGQGRTATDLTDVARAATMGAVDVLFVDIDEVVPGTIDDEGVVTLAERASASSYGVVDEIAARVLNAGGRILAVRRPEIPGGGNLAAILRYAA